jgi:hypothetical protein
MAFFWECFGFNAIFDLTLGCDWKVLMGEVADVNCQLKDCGLRNVLS